MERRIGPRAGLAGLLAGCCLVGSLAGAQPALNPAPDQVGLPAPPSLGPVVAPPPLADDAVNASQSAAKPQARIDLPAGPPRPERSPVAVLRVLDKVTAETLRFAAPVGRRVRYKGLVFEVKACETRGVGSADPRPSAYLIINSDLGPGASGEDQTKQIFKGWMFAQAPSVHALQHPVYDAWLDSCIAAAPGI